MHFLSHFTLEPRAPQRREVFLPRVLRALLRLLILLAALLTIATLWARETYGYITIEEILFHLVMPLQGTARDLTYSLLRWVFLPFAALSALIFAALLLPRHRVLFARLGSLRIPLLPLRLPLPLMAVGLVLWGMVFYPIADRFLAISEFVRGRLRDSTLIEERYVDPSSTALTFPEKKRNLITLYLESAETTSQDVASGGKMPVNYIPELTRLAQENVSFSQNARIAGATVAPACGWTVSALVAQTAGLPLKLYHPDPDANNMGMDLVRFLPGATTLGDLLEAQGYRNVFLAGSDFDFAGRRQYYIQHGHYDIYDYYTAIEDGWIDEDYYYGWGFEDQKLYGFAKGLLQELSASDQPFHFSLLTVDTHFPGFLCPLCPEDDGNIYGRTIRCASKQAWDFVAWCKQQPFYENTTIVVTGDHASMIGGFYDQSTQESYDVQLGSTERLVYNAFINAAATPVQEKDRRFTTLDFFPTVVASLGATIEGDRLGLGTNLFSARQTLSEEMGYEALFSELAAKSTFYDRHLLR